jgi:hypothetical protein
MDKNWLIRTKSNHILGPISKEKVLELYQNGSIKADDEVCSGNGFWFFIREDELVEKYLTGDDVQAFNPISEAKDVLTSKTGEPANSHEPDDITLVGGINLSQFNQPDKGEGETPPIPEGNQASVSPVSESPSVDSKKKNKIAPRLKGGNETRVMKPVKKQDWIKYAGILGFLLLFLLIYFRNSVINYLFSGEITSVIRIIDSAHAQEDLPEKKKSS